MSESQVDLVEGIPGSTVIRDQIREHVRKADLLRQMLRLADAKEARDRERAGGAEGTKRGDGK
jgi:hypothetical protein